MKKKVNKKSNKESLGVAGFTLSIAGFAALLLSPLLSIIFFITGLIFCIIQQKNVKTKLGKIGLILISIGIAATILYFIILIKYLIPKILELQGQFPAI